jgi:hypothetical protein
MTPDDPVKRFRELLSVPPSDRAVHDLRILEGLFAQAVASKKFTEALKIMEAAQLLVKKHGVRSP